MSELPDLCLPSISHHVVPCVKVTILNYRDLLLQVSSETIPISDISEENVVKTQDFKWLHLSSEESWRCRGRDNGIVLPCIVAAPH